MILREGGVLPPRLFRRIGIAGDVVGDQAFLDRPLKGDSDRGMYITYRAWSQPRVAFLDVQPIQVLGRKGANLSEADLSGADLSGATGVIDEQLAEARTLEGATMPDGSKHD